MIIYRKRFLVTLLFIGLYNMQISAQAPQSWTSAEMYQAIRKLNVLGSVLYVAAHPDDENTRLIAYLSKDRLYRTGYLSMTRGDGGQNLIGEEQGIELGLIRTQELLAARRIDGGEQFFTRAYDFGYSKNPKETFEKWDKDKILSDVVWVIRKFQPDVIITRFPATGEGGHGHHTASAILAEEAFSAAADPNRFPEQLMFVKTWQVKRILWNTFNFGGNNTTREGQFKFDVGGYNPLLGKSYGEISAESRSQHKSQGFGVPAGRGEAMEFFSAVKGDQPKNDLMEGIDLSWNRVPGGENISRVVDSISAGFDFLHPEKSVKGLLRLYELLERLPGSEWKNKKLNETKELILQCSGLFLDASSNEQYVAQTDSVRINFSLNNRLGLPVTARRIFFKNDFDTTLDISLGRNKNIGFGKMIFVKFEPGITQPYWLLAPKEEGYYTVRDQQLIGQPDVNPQYIAEFVLNIEGKDLGFQRPVKYKHTDPVRGELYQPLSVTPTVLITPDDRMKIFVNGKKEIAGELQLISKKKNAEASLITDYFLKNQKPDPSVTFSPSVIRFTEKNETANVNYLIRTDNSGVYDFLTLGKDGFSSSGSLKEIKYDHIPRITYFEPAAVTVSKIDVTTYNRKIGYIPGAGDKVPDALEQMGYEVTILTEKELSKNNLEKFDAILTGVRAYNTNEWMNKYFEKLKKYVHEGGNLIVQYNTSNQIGPVRARIAPYNFNISRTRVTDENAAVNILKPDHPVFNFPNKITQEDFKGWIQERSVYHATGWDSTKFETVLSMNDPGEKPDEGSLIIAKHGKGYFTYTGIVFFRQLPAAVPGAYRLLANLIALNRKKGF